MLDVRRGFRPRIRTRHVVAGAALVLITTGGATAAGMITGNDIKDGSVSTKDVKNGSLLLKDFKKSERSKLIGPAGPTGGAGANGATGATGAAGGTGATGASAFAPPPSGTVIKGGGILNANVSGAGVVLRSFAPLPFTTTTPLKVGAGRNLWFGPENAASLSATEVNAGSCPGTAAAPNPTAGNMCVYVKEATNVAAANGFLYPGASEVADAAESNGFYVYTSSSAAGSMLVRYVWAYKAP